jgi:hypothetical protein
LPPPFRPQLVGGYAVVGICFLRLSGLRPRRIPARLGVRIESAAYRIATELDTPWGVEPSVYVMRRVTDSPVAALASGRMFPGAQTRARFTVNESADDVDVAFSTRDGRTDAAISARVTNALESRLFANVRELEAFFRAAPIGWSPGRASGVVEGVELECDRWSMTPATVRHVESRYFDDLARFPAGALELDSAVLMRQLPVRWRAVVGGPSACGQPMRTSTEGE